MARLVWPAIVVLLILAVAGPCLTFYLLIKDYWAEVSSLRRDLLFCQLGSTDLPLEFNLDLEAALTSPSSALPLPPAALPLVATTASTTTTAAGGSVPPTSTSPAVAAASASTGPPPSPSSPPRHSSSPFASRSSSSSSSSLSSSSPSSSPPSSPSSPRAVSADQLMLGDIPMPDDGPPPQLPDEGSTALPPTPTRSASDTDFDITDKEYVALLERQLRDLRARVNACRSCLLPPQKKLPTCGGGRAWRDYRRRRRLLRRKEREQKEERRRRRQEEKRHRAAEEETTTTTTTPPAGATNSPGGANDTSEAQGSTTEASAPVDSSDAAGEPVLADVAYSDPKMESKRARETHRMSTDFRRGFNQKISRMDEALMQFTDTQASFCKELRDNLGGRLGKRGQELEALSEQIAALVRTSTDQITALERVASDQLYSGQASIEKSMAITQAIRDSQLRAIQNYHKQTFLPAAAAVATILTDQASAATSMGVELITKIEMLQDVYLTYATRQADTLKKLTEDVDMFASKHTNLLMRSKDHANHIHINAENFVRELQTRMNNVVKELVLIRLQSQNFVSVSNDSHTDIFHSLNSTQAAVENLSMGLRNRLDNATVLERDFRKIFKAETNRISDRVENGISEALVSNHASVRHIEEAELDTRVFVGTATAAWNELYLNQEAELRKEADALSHSLRSHTHHTQNVLAGMRTAAETHEEVLEEQRMDFQRFIRKRQDALDNQCSAITDWALLMSTELRRRDEDLHRFLSEDLQYATGNLPVRGDCL